DLDPAVQQRVAERFIAACAGGDLGALLDALDADVVGQVDLGARPGTGRRLAGREAVATGLLRFFGPGRGLDLVSFPSFRHSVVLAFDHDKALVGLLELRTEGSLIDHIRAIADPGKLAAVLSA